MDTRHTVQGSPPAAIEAAVEVFRHHSKQLLSSGVNQVTDVMSVVGADLSSSGWACSNGRRSSSGVAIGKTPRRTVRADARHSSGAALWLELGRAWTNNAALLHLIEASIIANPPDVVLGVRGSYQGQRTYEQCRDLFEDIATSNLSLPLPSVTLFAF